MPETFAFTLNFKVRDYECDLQGIVNNSVYQNYLEHTRHEFLLSRDVNFAALAREGINLVVRRAEIDYLGSLTSGDSFWVGLNTEREGRLKLIFTQHIYRQHDQRQVLAARITGAAVNARGRPFFPEQLQQLL